MNHNLPEYDGETRESIESVTWQHVLEGTSALKRLCIAVRNDFDVEPDPFRPGTRAIQEWQDCRYVLKAWVFGRLHLVSAIDHALALERAIVEPCLAITAHTCARVILEQCTITYWLLDPEVDWRERTYRVMKNRLHEISEFKKFHNHYKHGFAENSQERNLNQRVLEEEEIEGLSKRLGLEDSLGDRRQLGMTSLTDEFVGEMSFEYRMLSSVSHGREWALIEEFVEYDEMKLFAIKPNFDLYHVFSVVNYSINWIAKATWSWFVMSGWDFSGIATLLTRDYDKNGVLAKSRFIPPR